MSKPLDAWQEDDDDDMSWADDNDLPPQPMAQVVPTTNGAVKGSILPNGQLVSGSLFSGSQPKSGSVGLHNASKPVVDLSAFEENEEEDFDFGDDEDFDVPVENKPNDENSAKLDITDFIETEDDDVKPDILQQSPDLGSMSDDADWDGPDLNSGASRSLENPLTDVDTELHRKYSECIAGVSKKNVNAILDELREMVLLYGVPRDPPGSSRSMSIRGQLWKLFLRVGKLDSKQYISLLEQAKAKGVTDVYRKIKNDTGRTMNVGDKSLKSVISEETLLRVLNAYEEFKQLANKDIRSRIGYVKYVQSCGPLLAPLIFVMPELDAFYSYTRFMKHVPLFVDQNMSGVDAAKGLVGEVLDIVDPELSSYLVKCDPKYSQFAHSTLSSLCVDSKPFSEVLKLWDFLIAFGTHNIVMVYVALLMQRRDELISHPAPISLLAAVSPYLTRTHQLETDKVIDIVISIIIPKIPDTLYENIVVHQIRSQSRLSIDRQDF